MVGDLDRMRAAGPGRGAGAVREARAPAAIRIDLTGGTSDSGPELENFVNDAGSEHVQASKFPDLVSRLQEITQVTDIDFLVDALLQSNGDIDAAADYVYSHIR